ncbi:hypothetical protein CF386_03235 [Paraphotobacterium marinum]|uniref:HTH lysR-type domain-containing protein n=1 Tax=Paraphotobacterium marinum TaxID=1755811 RepID=A0A220VCP9_9GAMM|nr:LysR substrate-binding domain-containing protein [Paraphotobacterium marinum]ASK78119.1 hypothetical protein CF386_03235 [Paraphotobacterium marinum]
MNIRNLKLFVRLAYHKNFSQTALENNITPSALSRIIKGMEDELGFIICERNNRVVRITEQGKKLLETAKKIDEIWFDYKSSLNKKHTFSGKLKIFSSVTASYSHLPFLIKKIQNISDQIAISVSTGDHEMGFKYVASGQCDLSICIKPTQNLQNTNFFNLSEIKLILIYPTNFKTSFCLDSIFKHPIILPSQGFIRAKINNWLKINNLTPPIFAEVTGNEIIANMVSLGYGFGIIPEPVLEFCPVSNKISKYQLDSLPCFSLGVLYKTEKNSLVNALMREMFYSD